MSAVEASQQETIEALLDRSKRDHLPLENAFVQVRREGKGRPGPLSWFVGAHHERALHQYLLAHATASGGNWDVAHDSRVWARALGLSSRQPSSRNSVSRNWAWLEDRKLIARSRYGRLSRVTLLRDDGSGRPYVRPTSHFLKLPYSFWRDEWYRQLDLAALAVLLIARSQPQPFTLAMERVPEWYGISTTSFQKGIKALKHRNLLRTWYQKESRALAPEGFTRVNYYALDGAFVLPKADGG